MRCGRIRRARLVRLRSDGEPNGGEGESYLGDQVTRSALKDCNAGEDEAEDAEPNNREGNGQQHSSHAEQVVLHAQRDARSTPENYDQLEMTRRREFAPLFPAIAEESANERSGDLASSAVGTPNV